MGARKRKEFPNNDATDDVCAGVVVVVLLPCGPLLPLDGDFYSLTARMGEEGVTLARTAGEFVAPNASIQSCMWGSHTGQWEGDIHDGGTTESLLQAARLTRSLRPPPRRAGKPWLAVLNR